MDWRANLGVGDCIDAQDQDSNWYDSKVVEVNHVGELKVNFGGWTAKWDTWFLRNDEKLQPVHTKVPDWRSFHVNDHLEVCSDYRVVKWYDAHVTLVDEPGRRIKLRSAPVISEDEWLPFNSDRICRFGTHVKRVGNAPQLDSSL